MEARGRRDVVGRVCLFVTGPVSVVLLNSRLFSLISLSTCRPSSEMALFRGARSGHRILPISPTPKLLFEIFKLFRRHPLLHFPRLLRFELRAYKN